MFELSSWRTGYIQIHLESLARIEVRWGDGPLGKSVVQYELDWYECHPAHGRRISSSHVALHADPMFNDVPHVVS